MEKKIIERLAEMDRLSNIDVIHILSHGRADVLFYDENIGLTVKMRGSTAFAVPFSDDFMPLLPSLDGEELICVHSGKMASYFIDKLKYSCNGACYTFSYSGERKKEDGKYSFRLMRMDEIPFILSYYRSHEESLRYDIEHDNIICIEKNGEVLGFSGFHSEEAMGLLTILPQYRRMGLGRRMESHIINVAIDRGWVPFCNVYEDNRASIALQHSLGLKEGKSLCWWVWKEG